MPLTPHVCTQATATAPFKTHEQLMCDCLSIRHPIHPSWYTVTKTIKTTCSCRSACWKVTAAVCMPWRDPLCVFRPYGAPYRDYRQVVPPGVAQSGSILNLHGVAEQSMYKQDGCTCLLEQSKYASWAGVCLLVTLYALPRGCALHHQHQHHL
jgi:hypothetical protein